MLDERFLTEEYLQLFLREWKRFDVCSGAYMEEYVERFWNEQSKNE